MEEKETEGSEERRGEEDWGERRRLRGRPRGLVKMRL
jgi:hypothetical protein